MSIKYYLVFCASPTPTGAAWLLLNKKIIRIFFTQHHMFAVGLDVDTRAYFTAATCAISLNKSLRVNFSPLSFSNFIKSYKTTNVFQAKRIASLENTEITLWEKPLGFSSKFNINTSKLSNLQRNSIQLTSRVKSIIIGILLSDGWVQKRPNWNPRIGLKQSIGNFPYLWHIFNEIAYLNSGLPLLGKSLMRGKLFFNVSFQTRQLSSLIEIFDLFYIYKEGKLVKTIKPDLYLYMNYIVLAHWIQGDGAKKNNGVTLCTDSFSLQEIVLLTNILIIKFNISPTIHREKNNFRIYINNKDLIRIKQFIKPYFVDQFLYKIN